VREGGNHSVYVNINARKVSSIPRHREINDFLAKKQRSRGPCTLMQPGLP
jgi:hypothetical protein